MSDEKVLEALEIDDMAYGVESLTPEEALSEYNRTLKNPRYTEPGGEDQWTHKKRVERMGKLFEKAFPEKMKLAEAREKSSNKNLFDQLHREGVTKESLDADEDRIAEREDKEEIEKARSSLAKYFGGEKEADEALKSARSIFKRFATKEDKRFVDEVGLGNDPEFIQKLAEIDEILKRGGRRRK